MKELLQVPQMTVTTTLEFLHFFTAVYKYVMLVTDK